MNFDDTTELEDHSFHIKLICIWY